MKLHNETVSPRLIRCLKTIMQSDILKTSTWLVERV